MFLSIEWAKRWLPAVFLLLSLLLPWWMNFQVTMMIKAPVGVIRPPSYELDMSFPWHDMVEVEIYNRGTGFVYYGFCGIRFYRVPYSCFVSAMIFVSGLCGLSSKSKIRTLAGLLGIASLISYFVLIFPEAIYGAGASIIVFHTPVQRVRSFPYFGFAQVEWGVQNILRTYSTWFLSIGFFLALAGSLMLLSPLIRTSTQKLRKRACRILKLGGVERFNY